MTENEGLQPHELANQLANADYEIVNGRVESVRLAALIDRSQGVWRQLGRGRFDEDEHGFATIRIEDWSNDPRSSVTSDHVDALDVTYNDPKGNSTPLGRVSRLTAEESKGTAYVATGRGTYVSLLPTDRGWNAVVGVVERAVDRCYEEKKKGGRQWEGRQ